MRSEPALAAHNIALLDRVNRSGDAFLSQAMLKGRTALRLAVGNLRTTGADVERARQRLVSEAGGADETASAS
jgi:hypothetical protein